MAGDLEPIKAMPTLEVALATFNSERFLAAQLDSLFAQSYQDFTILVADDGSADTTMGIVADYARTHPGRIRVVAEGPHLGVLGNFSRLFEAATADYLMPCDHDDVWLPFKIELSLTKMRTLEAAHAPETPLLVHTDLTVVDRDLEVLSPSFVSYSGIDPERRLLPELLLENIVTGCATLANRWLYGRARPVPAEAMMYDQWLALTAAATGGIGFVSESTILYRQHEGNAIGARKPGAVSLGARVWQTLFSRELELRFYGYSRQASALLARFPDDMAPPHRAPVETLAGVWSISRWRRFRELRASGVSPRGLLRTVALFVVATRANQPPDAKRGYS